MSSANEIVLITGGNSGIGFETAKALLQQARPYHVVIGCRSLERGKEALARLDAMTKNGSFHTASLQQLDVIDEASITAAAHAIDKQYGRLDVLINNAGHLVKEGSLGERLRTTFEVNCFAPAIMTVTFAPLLEKSQNARVIHVSSSVGSLTLQSDGKRPGQASDLSWPYRMSKAALNMMMISQHTLYGDKIKVWSFDPGLVITNLGANPENIRDRGGKDPATSASALIKLVTGDRDADVGKHVFADGVHPW